MSHSTDSSAHVNSDAFPTEIFLYAVANGVYPDDECDGCTSCDGYEPDPSDEAWYVSEFFRSLDLPSDPEPARASWVDHYRGLIPRDVADLIAGRSLQGRRD